MIKTRFKDADGETIYVGDIVSVCEYPGKYVGGQMDFEGVILIEDGKVTITYLDIGEEESFPLSMFPIKGRRILKEYERKAYWKSLMLGAEPSKKLYKRELYPYGKAWTISCDDEEECFVVFADTKGKAREYAIQHDLFPYETFTSLNVRRFKEADPLCDGRKEMDWLNDNDRIFLCQHGWYCTSEVETKCETCAANRVCERSSVKEKQNDY